MSRLPTTYAIRLTDEQRAAFELVTRNGRSAASRIRHARVLLLSDLGRTGGPMTGPQVAEALGMHVNTVARVRKKFVTEGEGPALERKARETPPVPPKIDGHVEAQLIAICCGPPPAGQARWTLELLAGELAARKLVTSISGEAVRLTLKKTRSSPGRSGPGSSPRRITPGSSPRWRTSSTSTPPGTPPKSP